MDPKWEMANFLCKIEDSLERSARYFPRHNFETKNSSCDVTTIDEIHCQRSIYSNFCQIVYGNGENVEQLTICDVRGAN